VALYARRCIVKITWAHVALAALACAMVIVILGICLWLVEKNFAPPSLLLAPLSTILVGGAGSLVAYWQGLQRMPPSPPGTEYRLVPSWSPPPPDATLEGKVALPVLSDIPVGWEDLDTPRETPEAKAKG